MEGKTISDVNNLMMDVDCMFAALYGVGDFRSIISAIENPQNEDLSYETVVMRHITSDPTRVLTLEKEIRIFILLKEVGAAIREERGIDSNLNKIIDDLHFDIRLGKKAKNAFSAAEKFFNENFGDELKKHFDMIPNDPLPYPP